MNEIISPDTVRNTETETADPQLQKPPMFRILMLNDDFTPMDFVIHVLISLFQKSEEVANQLMLQVHNQGSALCGIYSRDIAESKIRLVENASRTDGHPLRCIMEIDNGS
ncbi:MAG: ATP-dependent Clp protease adapter ClpS [Mariprofundus sp.]|nr:ATP-dependent Clp protease adapter ClpS [Mariprofundus sp.]